MKLWELTAYSEEKFHIKEQHKWTDFPGFSVLAAPDTGKWIALLMRQWDSYLGEEIQRCDIKCGRQILSESKAPYLSLPFRMKGNRWVGVKFDDRTEPDMVFRLFDRAVYASQERGYTVVLDVASTKSSILYPDTAIPLSGAQFSVAALEVPDKIRRMQRLYQYSDSSFAQKCRNFYRQGKFMEDYEDDAPWNGEFRRYFTTYHDLNLRQLRGYFTWRTRLRKGDFSPIAASLAYLYLYELLNGIGTSSPEDSLRKMREFEIGFLDSGIGDPGIRGNLRRWMLEYAVLHNVSPALARQYADPALLKKDSALAVLKNPNAASEEEIFEALCVFEGKKLEQSPVVKRDVTKGKHFFSSVWLCASRTFPQNGKDIFTACFGKPKSFSWYPLSNAVYCKNQKSPDTDYILDPCRTYRCRNGLWHEERYDNLYFDRNRFHGLLREADRILRKALKTGHYLRENPADAWATPYAEEVIQSFRQAKLEAARPNITIDLSHLEQIRQDALITRDSLLTQEDLDTEAIRVPGVSPGGKPGIDADGHPDMEANGTPDVFANGHSNTDANKESDIIANKESCADANRTLGIPRIEDPARPVNQKEASESMSSMPAALDAVHRQILLALTENVPIAPYLRANYLIPSVAADTINEALFDEIGDNVLECNGDTITLIEDYRDDILQILGGKGNE